MGRPLFLTREKVLMLSDIMAKDPPISLPTLRKWIKAGEFKDIIFKYSRYYYLKETDWDKFLAKFKLK
ncbi:hypothetical protein KKG41_01065 [Patescibacteria group bacterium]|nr:hypothetical protein [Patescibacteria group bacterium]